MHCCKKKYTLLFLIIVLGFLIRIFHLSDVPHGFFTDEAAAGYNAYTLFHTGRDEFGRLLPIFFTSYGGHNLPVSIYTAVPFVGPFGPTESSVRIQAVLFGIVTILSLYLLSASIYSIRFGLLTAFFGTITPWIIHFNRTGFDGSSYSALFTLSVAVLFWTARKKRNIFLYFLSLAVTLYTYQSAKLMVPLLLFISLIFYGKLFLSHKRNFFLGILVFIIISIPLVQSHISGEGWTRFKQTSIFFVNLTPVEIRTKMVNQYLLQFNPSYFFTIGEPTSNTRHLTVGLLPALPIFAPFCFIGIIFLFIRIRKKEHLILILLLLTYPLAGTLGNEGPYSHRSIIGGPLLAVITALGFFVFFRFVRKKMILLFPPLLLFTICLISYSLFQFLSYYFFTYPAVSSDYWGWQYGFRPAMEVLKTQEKNYDELFITHRFNMGEGLLRFYNITFQCEKCHVMPNPISINPDRKELFAIRTDDINEAKKLYPDFGFREKEKIYLPNNQPEIFIGEFYQNSF